MRLSPLLLLIGCWSCSSDETPETLPIVRLDLAPEDSADSEDVRAGGPTSIWKVELDGPLEGPWTQPEGEFPVVPYERRVKGLPKEPGGWLVTERVVLQVRGDFDPQQFNQAIVTVTTTNSCDLAMTGRGKKKSSIRSKRSHLRDRGTHQMIVDLSTFRSVVDMWGLAIAIQPRNCRQVVLHSIELVQVDQESLLPPIGEAGPLEIATGTRMGFTLKEDRALRAKATAGVDARLRLEGIVPISVWEGPTTIQVTAEGDAGANVHDLHVTEPDAWVPLDVELAPGEWRFRVALAEGYAFLASPRIERKLEEPPAVVLITSDTHRADTLGLEDGTRTPYLDRLAQNGVYYRDCFAATNITNPSHVSIMTGLSVCETGITNNTTALTDRGRTLAEAFQEAGYYTFASLSSKHLNHHQSGLGQGFDEVCSPIVSTIDSPVSLALAEAEFERSAHRPLFAWLHIFDAHTPYVVPEKYQNLYYDAAKDPYDPSLPAMPVAAVAKWDKELRDPDFIRAQYRSEVTYLDEKLSLAMAHPRLANAVIALTSDHGEHLGNHGIYWDHKGLYPETLAVPLILSGPGIPVGRVVDASTENVDLGRTLLDAAGHPAVEFPGRSLLEVLEDESRSTPRFAISSHGFAASLEWQGWHLVLSMQRHEVPKRQPGDVELYYLPEDPNCQTNLAEQEPERTEQMLERVLEWLERGKPGAMGRSIEVNEQMLQDLASLGYATEVESQESDSWFTPDWDDQDQ